MHEYKWHVHGRQHLRTIHGFSRPAWLDRQHSFLSVSNVELTAQFSQGQLGGVGSTVFAGLRRVTRVGLSAQFSQGQRGKVGSSV